MISQCLEVTGYNYCFEEILIHTWWWCQSAVEKFILSIVFSFNEDHLMCQVTLITVLVYCGLSYGFRCVRWSLLASIESYEQFPWAQKLYLAHHITIKDKCVISNQISSPFWYAIFDGLVWSYVNACWLGSINIISWPVWRTASMIIVECLTMQPNCL